MLPQRDLDMMQNSIMLLLYAAREFRVALANRVIVIDNYHWLAR